MADNQCADSSSVQDESGISVNKLRKSFADIANSILGRNDEDCHQRTTTEIHKLFLCFQRQCIEQPSVFVSALNPTQPPLVASSFSKWILSKSIKALSCLGFQDIHDVIRKSVQSILELIRQHDPGEFKVLVVQLILNLMVDLSAFVEGEQINYPFESSHLQLGQEAVSLLGNTLPEDVRLNLASSPLKIFNFPSVAELQFQLTEILRAMRHDIALFVSSEAIVWNIICSQLSNSNIRLKTSTLLLAHELIEAEEVVHRKPIWDLFFMYTGSLIEMRCSGELLAICKTQDFDEALKNLLGSVTLKARVFVQLSILHTSSLSHLLQSLSASVVMDSFFSSIVMPDLQTAVTHTLLELLDLFNAIGEKMVTTNHNLIAMLLSHFKIGRISPVFLELAQRTFAILESTPKGDLDSGKVLKGYLQQLLNSTRIQSSNEQVDINTQDLNCLCAVTFVLVKNLIQSAIKVEEVLIFGMVQTGITDTMFTSEFLSTTVQAWKQCLLSQKFSNEQVQCLLSTMQVLLEARDLIPIENECFKDLCMMASFPWFQLGNDNPVFCNYICNVQTDFRNFDSLATRVVCLRCLALISDTDGTAWKLMILQDTLAHTITEDLALLLPLYICSLDISHFVDDMISLCHKLKQLINSADDAIATALAKSMGQLLCIMSGNSVIARVATKDKQSYQVSVFCTVCDKMVPKSSLTRIQTSGVLSALEGILVELLQHPKPQIRLAILLSSQRWTNHCQAAAKDTVFEAILNLISDPDYHACYQLVQDGFLARWIVSSGDAEESDSLSESEEKIVTALKNALQEARAEKNVRLMEVLLKTISKLSVYAGDNLLLVLVILLLKNVWNDDLLSASMALVELQNVAAMKKISPRGLFKQFRKPLCNFLIEILVDFPSGQGPDWVTSFDTHTSNIINRVCKVFLFPNTKMFFLHILRFFLPALTMKPGPKASRIVRYVTKQLGLRRPELFMDNFKFIFPHLVCHCSKQELEQTLRFIQSESTIEVGSLLRCDFQRIHNELLLKAGTHFDQVFDGLAMLASQDGNYSGPVPIGCHNDMANYLQPKLLGFLAFLDSSLLNSNTSLNDKKLAVKSLVCIMKLMGHKHVSSVRQKLMATLRITLNISDIGFLNISCEAWDTFVRNLDFQTLGPMLNQIIATLLPLTESLPAGIARIFVFLIVENREHLSHFFHDLYFVPEIPELQEVNAVLKDYVDRGDFRALLVQSLRGIENENIEVRVLALKKLKSLLCSNQRSLQKLVISKEMVDPVVSDLVAALITKCKENDMRAKLAISQCLGEVGAIDPGRLELPPAKGDQFGLCYDEDFAYKLLQDLIHSFLEAGDPSVQDCSSYAIQELLKIYHCNDQNDNSSSPQGFGEKLWNRFQPQEKEILALFFSSKYIVSSNIKTELLPKPIFGSSKGNGFTTWLTSWVSDLLGKVRDFPPFQACAMIVRHDVYVAYFLLPYAVAQVLQQNPGEQEEILSEVHAVLTFDKVQKPSGSNFHHLCVQTVFSLLDRLSLETQRLHNLSANDTMSNSNEQILRSFLDSIELDLLSHVSYNCQAYARALLYLETYLKKNPSNLQQQLRFLQQIYAALDEPDGVTGVLAVSEEEPGIADLILVHEATGQLQDAFSCYERAVKMEPLKLLHHENLMKCLLSLDQPQTVLSYASGLIEDNEEWSKVANAYRIEAAWRLGKWDAMESFLECKTTDDGWGTSVGKILLSAKKQNWEVFESHLDILRNQQIGPLRAAAMENCAHQRGQIQLVKLHMLTDLEKGAKILLGRQENEIKNLLTEWATRRIQVQSSMHFQEPILNLQRVLLSMARDENPNLTGLVNQEIVQCWLQSAKLARKSGNQQRAYNCILEANLTNSPAVFVEKAKWLWSRGDQELAMTELQKGIQRHFPEKVSSFQERLALAKAKLLLARYCEESSNIETSSLILMFKEVVNVCSEWEDGLFHLAKCYDRILATIEKSEKKAEISVHIVKYYGQSLAYGCKHIFHSMPRLLSLWFDLGTQVAELHKTASSSTAIQLLGQLEARLRLLNTQIIAGLVEKLPPYMFLTAFPQLISRICHSHEDVIRQLQEIIAKLLITFPQQAMWMMMAMSKSSYPVRVKRCQQIFEKAKQRDPRMHKFIDDSTKLSDRLLELCNKPVERVSVTLSIKQHFRGLFRLLERDFSNIILPLQSAMVPSLPTEPAPSTDHDAFPKAHVYIQGFEDTVDVLASLQKPKKITIRGSDGNLYAMMCKPKDDLRKDCRLMEFNSLVNRYLKHDPESRKRGLHIRTYAVIPLNEECGLIEWVPNLTGLRLILNRIYKEKGLFTSGKELQKLKPNLTDSLETKLDIFKQKLLPRFPPMLAEWFVRTFPDPTTWYLARLAYCRTTAVMSMVGYILGLGDRHGENILLDASCGDIVHVDFNCLFNKGETFEWPERVPFRLTHNMVNAMGPLGYEGIFRRACEVTLRVMRNQMEALMSVLKPFVHDPLVEWSKPTKGSRNHLETGEINNEKALVHVSDIEQRLRGSLVSKKGLHGLPLSVEGQVTYLIHEATDENNLCQMYIGWAAYM